MTEEDFLTRWSRRKRSAAGEKTTAEPLPVRTETHSDPTKAVANAEPAFDPTTLPPIDSITALSDISAFLQKGVPAELTRAALRRVWTADPAIRDFVGLAENAWDFTDPNAMPGFGPLESSDEIRRMVADLVDRIGRPATPGGAESASQNASDFNPLNSADANEPQCGADHGTANAEAAQNPEEPVLVQSNQENTATQHNVTEYSVDVTQTSRRPHGGALPR